MKLLRGIDSSFDPLTLDEARSMKSSGDIHLFGQCLWTGNQAPDCRVSNVRVAQDNGLYTWGYISLNGSGTGGWHVAAALNGFPQELWDKFLFVAVDIELPNILERDIVEACHRVEMHNQRAVIYTNLNSWHKYVIPSNTTALSRLGYPLLNAFWDEHPDVDFVNYPFGGWTPDQIIGEQYTGGQFVHGQYADNSMFYEERLRIPVPPAEEDTPMTPEERIAFQMMSNEVKELKGKVALAERLLGCDLRFDREHTDRTNALRCTIDRLITVLQQNGIVNDLLVADYLKAINHSQLHHEVVFKELTKFMRDGAEKYGVEKN